MRETIEMGKSDFVRLMAAVASPCSSFLPGEEPPPRWIEPDPKSCEHWLEVVAVIRAADAAIARTLEEQDRAEARGAADAELLASNGSALRGFADDLCGTPPKLPAPWPPPRRPIRRDGFAAPQLLVLAARFQAAADHVADHALAPDLNAAADRLFSAGLSRLAG